MEKKSPAFEARVRMTSFSARQQHHVIFLLAARTCLLLASTTIVGARRMVMLAAAACMSFLLPPLRGSCLLPSARTFEQECIPFLLDTAPPPA